MATRRATACLGQAPIGRPSSVTVPASGVSRRASSFSKVLLPEPFGPSTPTNVPGPTSIDTFRTAARRLSPPPRDWSPPRRVGYANETLRADSNADPDDAKATRCGIAQELFV